MVEKKDGDLLVGLAAGIHRAMNAVGWLVPVDLTGREFEVLARAVVAVFDRQGITCEDHRYAMERVTVPRCSLARRETQPPNPAIYLPASA
jgi:hypothetical protein